MQLNPLPYCVAGISTQASLSFMRSINCPTAVMVIFDASWEKECITKSDKFAIRLVTSYQDREVMHTVLIEVENENTIHLLQELEKLHILKIIKENVQERTIKLSEKYRGVFSKEDASSFDEHTQSMRKEWDNT